MHIPNLVGTARLTSSIQTPSLTGPHDCFVCGDPSDTILIAQSLFLLSLLVPLFVIIQKEVKPSSTLGRSFITITCLSYLAITIHATVKFFLDEWETSHDGPRTFRKGFIYSLTKGFWILGPAHYVLYFWGMVWVLMWWNGRGIYEDNVGEDEEEDEGGMQEVGEDTPLMG